MGTSAGPCTSPLPRVSTCCAATTVARASAARTTGTAYCCAARAEVALASRPGASAGRATRSRALDAPAAGSTIFRPGCGLSTGSGAGCTTAASICRHAPVDTGSTATQRGAPSASAVRCSIVPLRAPAITTSPHHEKKKHASHSSREPCPPQKIAAQHPNPVVRRARVACPITAQRYDPNGAQANTSRWGNSSRLIRSRRESTLASIWRGERNERSESRCDESGKRKRGAL